MKTTSFYLLPLLALGVLAGCGGGGTSSSPSVSADSATRGAGTVQFTIQWPPPPPPASRQAAAAMGGSGSRVIPVSAQSIDIVVESSATGKQLAHRLFVRPATVQATGKLDITNVPAGPVKVTARAFPENDGTGILQAQGFVNIAVKPGQTVPASLSMGSTVTHLKLFKKNDTLTVGDSEIVAVQAYNANDDVVMTGPSDWVFGTDAATYGGIASFTADGQFANVTAKAPGSYVITAFFKGTDVSQQSLQESASLTVNRAGSTSHLLILDHSPARIVGVDDITGAGFTTLGIPGVLHNPTDMALDSAGNIFIAEYQSSDSTGFYPGRIVELDPSGKFVDQFRPTSPPSTIYVDPQNRIYWRDDSGYINRMDNIHGDNRQRFGGFSSGLFGDPVGIATDSNGLIYVLDGTGNRVVRVDNMNGDNPVYFGSRGNGRNQFDLLDPNTYTGSNHGLAIDADNHVYVADYSNDRVVRFDANALNDPATSNFTAIPVQRPFGGGGANYFLPVSVAVSASGPVRIYFTGIEKASRSGPSDTNATINTFVVKADSIGSGQSDLHYFGGPVGTGDGQFTSPYAIALK